MPKNLDYLQRIFYGTSKTLTENMASGYAYKNVKRMISISVLYFDLGIGKDYIYCGETSFRGIHESDVLQLADDQLKFFKNPAITRVENVFAQYYLIQAPKFNDIIRDSLEEWVYFFKNSAVKGELKAKGLDEAQKRFAIANLDEQERREYETYEDLLRSNASFAEQMKFETEEKAELEAEEMVKKAKIATIENGLSSGLSVELLA